MAEVRMGTLKLQSLETSKLKNEKDKVATFAAKKHEKRVATFAGFIAKLQQGLDNNEGQFFYYATKKLIPFVSLLKKQGIVHNYYLLTTTTQRQTMGLYLSPAFDSRILVVHLKMSDKYAPALRQLRLFTVPSRALTISYAKLSEKVIASGTSTLYVLNTPKGLLTHMEAVQQRVGGEVVCKIS